LPALLVGIALLPARALPRGLALSWHDTRLSVGLFGTACLLAAGVIYMLAH
jgi:hypothetical protein